MNLLLFTLVGLISFVTSLDFYDGLTNSKVQVATYLTSPVTKIIISTEVTNTGEKNADSYIIAIPKELESNLSSLEVIDTKSDKNLRTTRINDLRFPSGFKEEKLSKSNIYYSVPLPKTLLSGNSDSCTIKITIAYVHLLDPLPAQIKKSGKQYVVYENNRYFYSPYKTKKSSIKFTLASDKIKSYTKPATVKDKKITYGPYNDLGPFAISPVRLHYQFHVPFLTMTEVTRDLEISHWGNVRIEETFYLRHDGAKLKGPYEPGVIDRRFSSGDPSVVTDLKATLPKSAHGVYYTDRIGNISTSNFRSNANVASQKSSFLEIRPRYPLYGGWKTDFTIGYDVPSYDLIKKNSNSNEHILNVSFGIPFREPVTNLLITTIALPEGAYDVSIDCPYSIKLISNGNEIDAEQRRFTYLDTRIFGGRPIVKFESSNVASLHNKYFQVKYKYNENGIWKKLILIISGIFVFLFTILIFARINPNLDDEEEQALREETLLEHAPEITHSGKKGNKQTSSNNSNNNNNNSNSGASVFNDKNDIINALNDIDIDNSQANYLYKQIKNIKTSVKRGNNESLKTEVNRLCNQAKKNNNDKKQLARIIDELKAI